VRNDRDAVAAALRGYGAIGVLSLILILLSGNIIGAVLVLLWAWRSHTPWSDLGLVLGRNWAITFAGGIGIGVVLKLTMKAIVMPLLGADPVNHAFAYLSGNPAALPGMLATVILAAGFGEEIIWRGYLFDRLEPLRRAGGSAVVVVAGALLFGLAHYVDQGLSGVEQAVVTGIVFGSLYLWTGQLWICVSAHAAFDVTATLIIYWNLESRIAHLIFA
jgi:uncharacterized protein